MVATDIEIRPIAALKDNYIWIIVNIQQQCALVVDPGDAMPVLAYLNQHQLSLRGILITHHHWDHVNGVAGLIKHYPVPVYGSIHSQFSGLTHRLTENEVIQVNDFFPPYQIIPIPGHTLDHIAYYADNTLFCGDTLFAGGCGRLFEGSAEQLYTSLQKMAMLPDHTEVYCAHEYTLANLRFAHEVEPSNHQILERMEQVQALRKQNIPSIPSLLLEEKQTNPFLRCDVEEIIQQTERHVQHTLSNPLAVFTALRAWKNNF